jgi:anti-sigma regulatory factor (Ser/Thr protein kinase)
MTRPGGDRSLGATAQTKVAVLADHVLDLVVPARTDEVAVARHAVVEHLSRHGVSSVVVDDVELIASELITNAIVHPRPVPPDAAVLVHVEVSDQVVMTVANVGSAGAIPPVKAWVPAAPEAAAGRGLAIVRRLCDDVAVEQRGDFAVVSCHRHLPDGGVMR